jgi:ABC-type amino acid transport substrate-binding protein
MTTRVLPMIVLACSMLAVVFASVGRAALPKLVGTTGPGFKIQLTEAGQSVKKLKAGRYTLVVHDKAAIHDFHLTGPGIDNKVTSVPFIGTKTVAVTLKRGKYTFQCDPHAALGMKGSFTVI